MNNKINIYEDKELQSLKFELKVLEEKLQELSAEKNDYLNNIDEFNTQYNLKLGKLIQKILRIKQEILYKQNLKKEQEFQNIKENYEKAKEELRNIKLKKEELENNLDEVDEFGDEYDERYEELQGIKDEFEEKTQDLNEKRKQTKKGKEDFEEDPINREYKETKKDYENFSEGYEELLNEERFKLNNEEQKKLKQAFRKASKLCHPDIVPDELKEQAHEMMQRLNEAYRKKDIAKLKEILVSLESGYGFDIASDTINDKNILKSRIEDIKGEIDGIIQDIEAIKNDDIYKTIQKLDDWDEYFEQLKSEIKNEYDRLKKAKNKVT